MALQEQLALRVKDELKHEGMASYFDVVRHVKRMGAATVTEHPLPTGQSAADKRREDHGRSSAVLLCVADFGASHLGSFLLPTFSSLNAIHELVAERRDPLQQVVPT